MKGNTKIKWKYYLFTETSPVTTPHLYTYLLLLHFIGPQTLLISWETIAGPGCMKLEGKTSEKLLQTGSRKFPVYHRKYLMLSLIINKWVWCRYLNGTQCIQHVWIVAIACWNASTLTVLAGCYEWDDVIFGHSGKVCKKL